MPRKKREPIPQQDTGWEVANKPLCPDGKHQRTLDCALDYATGYSNSYHCTECGATRTVSGPRQGQW